MSGRSTTAVLLDAGPLIALTCYADALDLLFKPGWPVEIVDTVLKEMTRKTTPYQRARRGLRRLSQVDRADYERRPVPAEALLPTRSLMLFFSVAVAECASEFVRVASEFGTGSARRHLLPPLPR